MGILRTAGQGVGGGSATSTLLGGGGLCAILHTGRTALILQLLYPSLHQDNGNVGLKNKYICLEIKTSLFRPHIKKNGIHINFMTHLKVQ